MALYVGEGEGGGGGEEGGGSNDLKFEAVSEMIFPGGWGVQRQLISQPHPPTALYVSDYVSSNPPVTHVLHLCTKTKCICYRSLYHSPS